MNAISNAMRASNHVNPFGGWAASIREGPLLCVLASRRVCLCRGGVALGAAGPYVSCSWPGDRQQVRPPTGLIPSFWTVVRYPSTSLARTGVTSARVRRVRGTDSWTPGDARSGSSTGRRLCDVRCSSLCSPPPSKDWALAERSFGSSESVDTRRYPRGHPPRSPADRRGGDRLDGVCLRDLARAAPRPTPRGPASGSTSPVPVRRIRRRRIA